LDQELALLNLDIIYERRNINLIIMPTTYHKKKEEKMAKSQNRIKKMNFQIQERRVEELTPLSDDDKYVIEMAGYQKLIGRSNENIPRTARRPSRPSHI
jgi:hypothetical protein|tara:strand:- start:55 stop:351 length:297 start_codon:yes stop_codon:yes gene_type:complete